MSGIETRSVIERNRHREDIRCLLGKARENLAVAVDESGHAGIDRAGERRPGFHGANTLMARCISNSDEARYHPSFEILIRMSGCSSGIGLSKNLRTWCGTVSSKQIATANLVSLRVRRLY